MSWLRKVWTFLRMLRTPVFRSTSTHPTKAMRRSVEHSARKSAGWYPGGKWFKEGKRQ